MTIDIDKVIKKIKNGVQDKYNGTKARKHTKSHNTIKKVFVMCSNCGEWHKYYIQYCPNCYADMKKKDK